MIVTKRLLYDLSMNIPHHAAHAPAGSAPLDVFEGIFNAGEKGARPHIHGALELGVVISGAITLEYARFNAELRPGQLWWSGCWEPHAMLPLKRRAVVAGFLLRPEFIMSDPFGEIDWLAPFLVVPARRPQLTEQRDRQAAVAIARDALLAARQRPRGWRTTAWVELHRLVCLASRRWNRPALSAVPHIQGGIAAHRVAAAIRLVDERLPRSVCLGDAARACAMSRCRFATAFASATGVSFAKFALRARLACVANELLAGDASLKELARRWGFTDASHLHRVFTRHYGRTPGEFRR